MWRNRACCCWRRYRDISRPCCAPRCAPCWPSMTCSSPIGTICATWSCPHGTFGFDSYIAHIVEFLEAIGPGAHIVAVCQPCVAALVAAAVMAQTQNPAQPRSMTLMAGPIDTRINPTKVNELANSKPMEWFEHNLIATVPMRYPGAFRRVYPGFVQLTAFMSMNIARHIKAHQELYENLAKGEVEKA